MTAKILCPPNSRCRYPKMLPPFPRTKNWCRSQLAVEIHNSFTKNGFDLRSSRINVDMVIEIRFYKLSIIRSQDQYTESSDLARTSMSYIRRTQIVKDSLLRKTTGEIRALTRKLPLLGRFTTVIVAVCLIPKLTLNPCFSRCR